MKEQTPEIQLVEFLKKNELTITTAESITGGLIAKRITDVSGSSNVFHCGIVSYSNEIKKKILGVKRETLEKYFAVSSQTAAEMAEGARILSGADIAVSVTGIAGPSTDESDEEVGTFYIGISSENGTRTEKFETKYNKADCREHNRNYAATECLKQALIEAKTLK